ncbi:hypothetical protein C474_13804 [Halogeometricum pallidum JCM 14848]|uniref:Uncharacterized protein n=1 Tax=Halogeometricum pallidum JCM 14848 TaxID=1227487 RepID=M0D0F8_HALPD|nr:hypothetical protein C474_13804 [Halogeometricum pallidum JCM 14848]
MDTIFSFDEVNIQLFELLESEVVPTDSNEPLGIDDVGIDPLSPGIVVDVCSWHLKIRVHTLNTELKHRDASSMIRIREGMSENQIRHHLSSDGRKWGSPGHVIECLLDFLRFELLVEPKLILLSNIDSCLEQFH